MEQYHGPSKTKSNRTGAKRKKNTDKKLLHHGRPSASTKVISDGEETKKSVRTKGGGAKIKLKRGKYVNTVMKDGSKKKTVIKNVLETPDNRHHARQNIITKGAILETEIGKVKVTNRVGQDGIINGVQV